MAEIVIRLLDADGRPTWTLAYPQRPWTVNSERGRGGRNQSSRSSGHWTDRAELTKEWRQAFWGLAKEQRIPALTSIGIFVQQVCRNRKRPDPGACYPAVKAAIDGLVDAGVIPDDGPDYVDFITFWAPEVGTADALVLVVKGQPVRV